MQKTNPEISELKQQIEESLGRKMKTSADFTFLSGAIWERTHENLSASTLKRLWGYVDGADTTRNPAEIVYVQVRCQRACLLPVRCRYMEGSSHPYRDVHG